jgi:hypothetical protein
MSHTFPITRANFLVGILEIEGLILLFLAIPTSFRAQDVEGTPAAFDSKAFAALPMEGSYAFEKELAAGSWRVRRDYNARGTLEEVAISDGWTLLVQSEAGAFLQQSAQDLRDYLGTAMHTQVGLERKGMLADWEAQKRVIVAGTREQLPDCGSSLKGAKDYQIIVSHERVAVCGFDELGAMYGLYNLEERFDLREGPFLPKNLNTVRHSLYRARMTLSGLGWMEWPDRYLATLPRYGFDSIYESIYANPNGVPAPSPYYDMCKRQNPERLHDLIRRAGRYGIKVYCPILYYYKGDPQDAARLRGLVRDIVTEFPEIRGYVLLTEGFDAETAPWDYKGDIHEWIIKWAKAVDIVAEECHRLNPTIEVLPWDYNIDFDPSQVRLKTFVIDQLPHGTIPLLTFENGKSFSLDQEQGYLKDYSISQVGPAEVAAAQIAEAKKRGFSGVYAKADTWASWQFGTFPYLPFPYQWYARYQALEKSGIDGVMESWTYGFKPNFVAEMRAWYSWSDAPPLEDLLRVIARRDFGPGSEDLVLNAWKHFSTAIQFDPDTGPSAGSNNAVAHPLFFEPPEPRTFTAEHGQWEQKLWFAQSRVNPYWPYVFGVPFDGFLLYPDFSNQSNVAEDYAKPFSLKVFIKYLSAAADEMEKGLVPYRHAALNAPPSKQRYAFREVLLAEQVERMMQSNRAVLEFEDLRFTLSKTVNLSEKQRLLDRMAAILMNEILRTQASLETARRDSRLGYEWETDYVYSPYTIEQKLQLLRKTLSEQVPRYREQHGLQ